jgi:hypothetical protein
LTRRRGIFDTEDIAQNAGKRPILRPFFSNCANRRKSRQFREWNRRNRLWELMQRCLPGFLLSNLQPAGYFACFAAWQALREIILSPAKSLMSRKTQKTQKMQNRQSASG